MNEEKTAYQAQIFANRLTRNYKQLRKWARKNRVTCYRLYDRDIPEVPLAADIYEFLPEGTESKEEAMKSLFLEEAAIQANDAAALKEAEGRRWLHLFLYERPYEKDPAEEEAWLSAMAEAACAVLHIARERVVTKVRKRQKGDSQYEKQAAPDAGRENAGGRGLVQECGELFTVNLRDYLDTGLFFDHRPLRSRIRDMAAEKRVLNLFCYTGSFSVYAAEGGASLVESVDLSNTYLSWAKANMIQNGFTVQTRYRFTKGDVAAFLDEAVKKGDKQYDIIILDPPTFSNSKSTKDLLDINRDWPLLCTRCLSLLDAGGILYFSTNSRRLAFDAALLPRVTKSGRAVSISDITDQSLPQDFSASRGTKNRRCWKMELAK